MNTRLVMLLFAIAFTTLGCATIGPRNVQYEHSDYNEAVRVAKDEQILLNLVRLAHSESPLLLNIDQINAQYRLSYGGSASTSISDSSSDVLTLSGTVAAAATGLVTDSSTDSGMRGGGGGVELSYFEQPTVTYTPLSGGKFAGQMLAGVTSSNLSGLAKSFPDIESLFHVVVQEVRPKSGALTPPIVNLPIDYRKRIERGDVLSTHWEGKFKSYAKILHSIENLNDYGYVKIGYKPVTPAKMHAITKRYPKASDGADSYLSMKVKYESVVENKLPEFFVINIENPKGEAFSGALPGEFEYLRDSFGAKEAVQGDLTLQAYRSDGPTLNTGENRIEVQTRSLSGVMTYLSQFVETSVPGKVPKKDGSISRDTASIDDHRIFKVFRSESRPVIAEIAVKYEGAWYFISKDDIQSKSVFMLLNSLIALQTPEVAGGTPKFLGL